MKKSSDYSICIAWLYPDLMSIYGDRGNIITMQKRCEWRGISITIKPITLETSEAKLAKCDLLFMGGAQDQQQTIVSKDLRDKGKILKAMIEEETPGLFICGAYQFLGNYYQEADGTKIQGLGIFDLYTVNPGIKHKRLIGNVAAKLSEHFLSISNMPYAISTIVGFENHGGRTYLGRDTTSFAKIVGGFGNNGEDHTEGAVYKNAIGTYFHGPLLPKNPHIADWLIEKALMKKYKKEILLDSLDDSLANQAHDEILGRLDISDELSIAKK